jgi:hypothetical protein
VVIELVDFATGRNVNSQWFHKTPALHKTLNPTWHEKNSAKWRDVHLSFESLALRISVFDEDIMDDDDPLGEVRSCSRSCRVNSITLVHALTRPSLQRRREREREREAPASFSLFFLHKTSFV